MYTVIALLAPGQGSQKPGMFTPWLDSPGAMDRLQLWSMAAGLDLVGLGTTASASDIADTAVTQPLVVAGALLAFEELRRTGELPSDTIVAGHSVGELAAVAIAGVISTDQAVELAAIRGAEMAKSCALQPTGMSAVLGGEESAVLTRLDELGLVPANRNAAGQIVAAGDRRALAELAANPPERTRIRSLPVAGAFHTDFMAPAQDAVAAAIARIEPSEPRLTLLSNADGRAVRSGSEALAKITAQVTRPVRWDLCSATVRREAVSRVVELPPAGTLVGIAKRELAGIELLAVGGPTDLAVLSELSAAG